MGKEKGPKILKVKAIKAAKKKEDEAKKKVVVKQPVPNVKSMFFRYNPKLGPPFSVILDTNFINFSIKNKLEISEKFMDCLLAKCFLYVTECVIAEIQKLNFKIALKVIKKSCQVIKCNHKGTYADDCIVNLVTTNRIYIVATCDRGLKRRLRKIPGVPIVFIVKRSYQVERLPD
jgi:rRNA-processing protein FCF1 homolog